MILFIDTSGFHQLKFALVGNSRTVKGKIYKVDHSQTAKTLGYFKKFFGKTKWKDIERIIVVSGPGSFSGIRVGVAMALAFSMAHDIPAFAQSGSKLTKINSKFNPVYGAEPNITPPRARQKRNN